MELLSLFAKVYLMNLIEYWREFGLLVLPLATWLTTRKMAAIKLRTEGAGSIAAIQSIYDKYLEHNSAITQELVSRVNQLEEHGRALQKNFNEMSISYMIVMDENKKIEAQYKQLLKNYEMLSADYERLKLEFDKYKKSNK